MAEILVTGGAGYIGAHVIRELVKAGYTPVVLDNLATGSKENMDSSIVFYEGDCGDESLLDRIFNNHKIEAVVHMAASIEVAESVKEPIAYLENNTQKTLVLLKAMTVKNIKHIIFSSTAAVYGIQDKMPVSESATPGPIDPYGQSKYLAEQLIQYFCRNTPMSAVVFRYFNACGSDFDKTIYSKHESHLIPIVMDVVAGKRPSIDVYGSDYDTVDGTGVRDYVHVLDIARAHVLALKYVLNIEQSMVMNIGTGHGYSVLQVIEKARQITGHPIPVNIMPRRDGDAPITVADNTRIKKELQFELKYSDMDTIIQTSLRG